MLKQFTQEIHKKEPFEQQQDIDFRIKEIIGEEIPITQLNQYQPTT